MEKKYNDGILLTGVERIQSKLLKYYNFHYITMVIFKFKNIDLEVKRFVDQCGVHEEQTEARIIGGQPTGKHEEQTEARIIGGQPTGKHEFPWHVSMRKIFIPLKSST